MIMRVIAMTPEQINMLPPPERAGIIQLVSSCSVFKDTLLSKTVLGILPCHFRVTLMPVTFRPSTASRPLHPHPRSHVSPRFHFPVLPAFFRDLASTSGSVQH